VAAFDKLFYGEKKKEEVLVGIRIIAMDSAASPDDNLQRLEEIQIRLSTHIKRIKATLPKARAFSSLEERVAFLVKRPDLLAAINSESFSVPRYSNRKPEIRAIVLEMKKANLISKSTYGMDVNLQPAIKEAQKQLKENERIQKTGS